MRTTTSASVTTFEKPTEPGATPTAPACTWMEEAGFTTGTKLDVRMMPGCLILTAQESLPAPPPDLEIMQTLRTVCKLSGRKQQQVTDLIEVISKPQR